MSDVKLHELIAKVDKLIESDKMTKAKIAVIEKFVRDLAIESLGDTSETKTFCERINTHILESLRI